MKIDYKKLQELQEKWQNDVLKPIKNKARQRPKKGHLAENNDPQDIYSPLDICEIDFEKEIGFPGSFPYTRGIQPNMYRGRYWTMRQYAGFGTASDTNKRYRYLLSQGQTGLSVAFDLPTQIGYDSDSPYAEGEVGKVGVAIDTIDDMEILFENIPLDKVSTSMTINSTASILLAMYIAVAEKRGIQSKLLNGTVQNDILKEYIARGTYIFPPRESMRIITDLFSYCGQNVTKWNVISISGYHMREAGCNAIQEVAFTLADGIAYVDAAIKAGLDVEQFGERLSFFFNVHNNFLEEVAKFRAARKLWAKIMNDRFKVKSDRAKTLRFHVQTAGCTLTAQQPLNNSVRVALQAMAAVLGGCQSLHTNSYDEALALPSEEAVTLALKTQQIIAHETGVADFVDPLGGSYVIESLTNIIEQKCVNYLNKIDEIGGMVAAIEKGYVQREIQNTSYEYQLSIEEKDRIVVGINEFISDKFNMPKLLKVDEQRESEQKERLKQIKGKRNWGEVKQLLFNLKEAAKIEGQPLFPHILLAVKSYASVQEISDTLREVFGEYKESITI